MLRSATLNFFIFAKRLLDSITVRKDGFIFFSSKKGHTDEHDDHNESVESGHNDYGYGYEYEPGEHTRHHDHTNYKKEHTESHEDHNDHSDYTERTTHTDIDYSEGAYHTDSGRHGHEDYTERQHDDS